VAHSVEHEAPQCEKKKKKHLCGTIVETVYHILWSCPSADVWGASYGTFQKTVVDGSDFFQVAEVLFAKDTVDELIFFR
jgi:hypothetical protein